MGAYKHFIFDMDGTLTDTAKATAIACNEAAEKLGLPPFPAERVKAAMGYPGLEYYQVLLGAANDDLLLDFQKETDLREAREIERIGREMLFPGVRETLEALCGLGVGLYVASTGHPDHINLLLDVTGIRRCFRMIRCGRPRKIEMTGEIMAASGAFGTGGWLFIGDKHIDAEAARGNGIPAAGAGYGYCSEKERRLFDMIIESPGELLALAG
ncbi:MAG: HAD family hydrolase [Treponema sp.]|jgi:phosphoglycolate phosphatase|nr:HAD family hydrolase [Treponema sp.]